MPIPCQTQGCDYPNFHVCLVGKPDTFPQLLRKLGEAQVASDGTQRGRRVPLTAAQKAAMEAGKAERWQRYREENKSRDDKIIERYKTGEVGTNGIAEEMGLGKSTVLKVLKRAEAQGRVTMRKRGVTLANSAKSANKEEVA